MHATPSDGRNRMLGWDISIRVATPEQVSDPEAGNDGDPTRILASWTTTSTLEWLSTLQRDGRAREILSSGYPLRYAARAGDVLPLLADEPLLGMGRWPFTRRTVHTDRIAACPAGQLLIIDAWDQS
ncbi:hypothetical protein [Streptomyces sp. NPDC048603]|uniref:hypothetical protein n=1 Tax=Streptomyces sp. NPDC048603 TaxID=3365577 RepID=UPI00371B2D8E